MKKFGWILLAGSFVVSSALILGACSKGGDSAGSAEGESKELSARAKAQKDVVYEIIDAYFAEKGVVQVEKALNEIIEKRRRGPSLEERMKNRVQVDLNGAPTKGPADAPITIVEFSDFGCPFCSRVLPTLDQVMKEYDGKIRLAFRHKPLPMHQSAPAMHIGAMAAQEQGKFWEYHDLAFSAQQEVRKVTEERFKKKQPKSEEEMAKLMNDIGVEFAQKWAKELKLDMAKFNADMKRDDFQKRLQDDIQFADANGSGGTPGFFVNGVALIGAQPFPAFKEVIDALLAEKK